MDRHFKFDIGYVHEMAACVLPARRDAVPSTPGGLALTMRLRCLKILYDLDRDPSSVGVDGRLDSLGPSTTA